MRHRRKPTGLLISLTAATALTACSSDTDGATKSLDAFLAAWRGGTIPGNEQQYQRLTDRLGTRTPELTADKVTVDGDNASAPVNVTWSLGGGVRWQYPTTVRLTQRDGNWQVDWTPATVHPDLAPGSQLVRRQGEQERGSIMNAAGEAITKPQPVVVVGVKRSAVTDPDKLAKDLGAALAADGVDTSGLPKRINEAKPDAFVSVITLRKERYSQIRAQIRDLPGTVFREETRVLAPTREYARALLGSVGPVTKDQLDRNPGKYVTGDEVGQGGLQQRYDDLLRGAPAVTVSAVADKPGDTGKELFRNEAKPGSPLRTTIDNKVQTAADAAVAPEAKKAALVAVRISDGAVLGVANSPSAGAQNLAMEAKVPPGSTFKMISALTLLDSGAVDLDQQVPCPATTTVEGRSFKNAWNGGLDNATFRSAFANSCNTAFVALAPKLGSDGLAKTAKPLGIGEPWDLGADMYAGSVPAGGSAVDQAAASFGQGKTVVSPIVIAGATAGVAAGQWRQPKLVLEPAPAKPAADGPQLNAGSLEKLRTMMREVITAGSAKALNGVKGGPVSGKTGTAEYGTENPPRSHSWFTGWQGDIAFAVFVEDGGNEASLAVSAAKRFLTAVNS
ncbi:hypothetical protein LWC34_35870 [Kibdelosporangium philippinense]|uniref:Cell division protein FtsI/penicillin-binding protein 2 n=1 Tax=Kibdelosporangium philippinense TaxID=211113 RepID=A0ABS8ZQS6_9PSEU|nr:penicillin-binding transpeptidase domain-containing protein [Kibdelosporangium philippinense]MCE7008157.1 hypothetical protein [Kibdelosporangium philippinense]